MKNEIGTPPPPPHPFKKGNVIIRCSWCLTNILCMTILGNKSAMLLMQDVRCLDFLLTANYLYIYMLIYKYIINADNTCIAGKGGHTPLF